MGGVSGGRRPGSPEAGLRPGRVQGGVERMGNADMSRSKFKGRDLTGAIFAAASVRQADLRDVKADGSTNTFAQFDLSDLRGSSWRRALMDRVTFYGADLRNASFKEAILSGSEFDGADICDLGGMERLEKLDEASFNRLEILDTPVGTACSTEEAAVDKKSPPFF